MHGAAPDPTAATRRRALLLALLVLVAGSLLAVVPLGSGGAGVAVASGEGPLLQVRNDPGPRFTVDAAPVDAHDGELVQLPDGTFALYGTAYGCGFRLGDPSSEFCGFRVYSSPDLRDWTFRGELFDPRTDEWQERCTRGAFGCFRPHVLHNPATSRWVLWVNVVDDPVGYRVLTSASPYGPFTEVAPPTLAVRDPSAEDGRAFGDHALHVDPETGTAYVVYTVLADDAHDLAVEELDSTYTTGTGRAVRLRFGSVESPDLLEHDGTWHLFFSDPPCPYCPTGTGHASAPSPLGPWTRTGRASADSCGGQPAGVAHVRAGDREMFVFSSDRWVVGDPNQREAGFVLTPVHLDGAGTPTVECRDAWQVGPDRRVRHTPAHTAGS